MNIVLIFFLVKSFLVTAPIVEAATCGVVPIHEWGSTPTRHEEALETPVGLVVVTHTVTTDCVTDAECERVARAIRNTQTELGQRDIGLSFLVGGNGKIYAGAGWKVGSHTNGYNKKSVSLSFIGDFRNKAPTKEALDVAEHFLGCYLNTRYLACEYKVVGHRQLQTTVSPGDALQRIIETWPHWTPDVSTFENYKDDE